MQLVDWHKCYRFTESVQIDASWKSFSFDIGAIYQIMH